VNAKPTVVVRAIAVERVLVGEHVTEKVVASARVMRFGEQEPRLSVRCDVFRRVDGRWQWERGGCLRATLEETFPELAPLVKWDGLSLPTPRAHHVATALLWWERAELEAALVDGDDGGFNEALEEFKSVVRFGAIEGEQLPPRGARAETVKAWLEGRFPELAAAFRRDLKGAGLLPTSSQNGKERDEDDRIEPIDGLRARLGRAGRGA
jgi:hypothetical protein